MRFRYTSYMGEFHPAEKKVVVEFSPEDFGLTEVQQMKLRKLAGARYNPEKETIKMSCESFEHQAQNKRYLAELVEKLVTEAKVCIRSFNVLVYTLSDTPIFLYIQDTSTTVMGTGLVVRYHDDIQWDDEVTLVCDLNHIQ